MSEKEKKMNEQAPPQATPPATEITVEEAIAWAEKKWWEGLDDRAVALAQLRQPRLCMPFDLFHQAREKAAGCSIWTHEFARPDGIIGMIENQSGRAEDPISSMARIREEVERSRGD